MEKAKREELDNWLKTINNDYSEKREIKEKSKMFEPNETDELLNAVIFNHPERGTLYRRLNHQKKCNVYYIRIDGVRMQVVGYNSDGTVYVA